jgi:hypothetical protein
MNDRFQSFGASTSRRWRSFSLVYGCSLLDASMQTLPRYLRVTLHCLRPQLIFVAAYLGRVGTCHSLELKKTAMRKKLLAASVLLLTHLQAVYAQSTVELAKQYVVLLRYGEQHEAYHEQCLGNYRSITPAALVAKNPSYFNGIKPDSPQWGPVNKAYEVYAQEACSRPTKSEFVGALASAYSESLSASDLKAAIGFYSSPTGNRLISAHKAAANSVNQYWGTKNREHLTEITAEFQKTITKLSEQR